MRSDTAEKEAATIEKKQRIAEAELNKEEAKAHNKAVRSLAEAGGPHPGYKTWGSTESYTTTAKATDPPPDTTTATTHYTTAATDPVYPTEHQQLPQIPTIHLDLPMGLPAEVGS